MINTDALNDYMNILNVFISHPLFISVVIAVILGIGVGALVIRKLNG